MKTTKEQAITITNKNFSMSAPFLRDFVAGNPELRSLREGVLFIK